MENLHGKIMNIQVEKRSQGKALNEAIQTKKSLKDIVYYAYQLGHRDARHAAAEIALRSENEDN